jgi:hypothetical protein
MAKTTTLTATRSLAEIVEEFVHITDSGALRLHQSRLAFEYIGNAEGAEASELKETFRKEANEALRRQNEAPLSVPGVTNLVNTWKYLQRANIVTDPDENEKAPAIAKAAFNLASQTFRKKDENYVNPAIEAIINGSDPEATFKKQTDLLKKDKKKDAEEKDARLKEKENDPNVVFDTIVATIGMITPENYSKWSAEQKSILADLVKNVTAVVK